MWDGRSITPKESTHARTSSSEVRLTQVTSSGRGWLVTQYGVTPAGRHLLPARRDDRSQQSGEADQHYRKCQDQRIPWIKIEKLTCHQLARSQRSGNPQSKAHTNLPERTPQHHFDDAAAVCANAIRTPISPVRRTTV